MTLFSCQIDAQDALFSQFLRTKSLLNPALQATQNGAMQFQMAYREQGGSISNGLPIRTIFTELSFRTSGIGDDVFGFGLNVLGDKGGEGHVGKNMSFLSFSYLKKLTGKYSKIGEHFLGAGAQLGGGQYTVGWDRFWFGNQFNREYGFIDTSIDSGESEIEAQEVGRSGLIYDINAGILWYGNLKNGLSFHAGISAYHLTRSNISFFDDQVNRLNMRYNIHGGATVRISELLNLSPQAIYVFQGKSSQLVIGSEIGIDNGDVSEFSFRIGAFTRVVNSSTSMAFESMILSVNTQYNQFNFGFAYDITLSTLSKYNGRRGSWEFNLSYLIPPKQKSYNKGSPTFRF